MADLSSILAQGNALAAQQVNAVPPPAPEKSNLRAGLLEYHAKINNALALGAENLGMGGAQQRLLNQADAGMREAQQVAPERQNTVMGDMKSPMDAYRSGQLGNYIGDTLHNLPGDIVRGAPAMAAPLVAGMVGTALSGGNPLVGGMAGAATMMPQTVGDIAERQYANPDNKDSAGLRALKATGYGAASAVAQNIVPQWMGGKLVGKTAVQGVERAAGNVVGRTTEEVVQNTLANKTLASVAAKPVAPSLATNVAKNLAESVGGNAVAGAGAELANQLGANEQIDTGKMGTAAVEGGVMGSAFAPLGIAGEMRGGRSSAESAAIAASRAQRGLAPDGTPLPAGGPPEGPGGAPGGATTPAGRKAAREAPAAAPVEPTVGSAAPIQEAMDKAKAGKTVADKLAAGEPLMDNVSDFVSAVGDKATQMYDKGKATASEWVKKAAQEYVKRRDLTPEQRATAEAAAANPSDDANHQAMGLLFNELSQKDHDATVLDQLDKDFPEKKGDKGSKQSASTAAADKRIASITEPYLKGKHPETVTRANAVLRRLAASAGEGDMNEPAARRLIQLLGPQAHEMAQRVYDAVAPREAVSDARMARHINKMQVIGERDRGLGKVIDQSLPEDHNINVTHLKEALMRWARGDDDIGADARGKTDHAAIRQQIKDMFGPKADAVFDALETYANREDDKPGSTQNIKHDKDALDRGDQGSRRGDIAQEVGADYGDLDEGAMDPIYYGGGSNPLAMSEMLEDPDVYRAKHERESPAEKLWKKLKGNDDLPEDMGGSGKRNIYWMSEKAYNQRHGIREPVYTPDGHETGETEAKGSTTHGYLVHEESNDPTKFNDNDFAATRLNMKKYGRSAARINIDSEIKPEKNSKGEKMTEGQKAKAIDAVRLTERFMRNQETGTGEPNVVRSGKAFMDGILALQEKLEADGDPREFIDEAGLEKLVADGEIPKDAKLEEYGLVLLPDSLKIDKEGNTYGGMKQALRQISARDIKNERAMLKLNYNEKKQLEELRKDFQKQTKEEQKLRLQEAEEIYAQAKGRAKDKELGVDKENDLTRRKTSTKNKGNEGVVGVAETNATWATGEGDVIKGRDAKGNPIYDLSARTQAEAWFDEEGVAKASKAIDQLGDVHGGIDTGRVQEKARHNFIERIRAKANEEKRPINAREQAAIDRIQTRNEARTPPDARTGKEPMFDADGKQRAFDSSGSGRTEVSLDENPHLVAAVEGDDMKRGMNMDDTPQSIDRSKAFKTPEEKRTLVQAAARLADSGNQQEKAAGRKIGSRMMTLVENADSMSLKDVNRLKRVGEQINMGKLKAADASTVVNELARKYSATIMDNREVRENPRGFVERVVRTSHGGEDSAGPVTQPVKTRPEPPAPTMVKSGKKPREDYNKGTPTAMLKESLGTHVPDLINTVERINEAIKNGDAPEVDMKTSKGRKAVKDFLAANKEYEVTHAEDGTPVLTRSEGPPSPKAEAAKKAALVEAASSSDPALLHELRTTDDAHGLQRTTDYLNDVYDKYVAGNSFYETLQSGDPDAMLRFTREAVDDIKRSGDTSVDALETIQALETTGEALSYGMRKTEANKAVNDLLERGPQSFSTLVDAMVDHLDQSQAALAQVLQQIVGDMKVVKRELGPDGGRYFGAHNINTGIHITQFGENISATTLLHEGVHAATVKALDTDHTLRGAIESLMEDTRKADSSLAQEYGYADAKEFLAEAMTNPSLQAKLRALKPSARADAAMKGRSIWSDLVDYLAEWMGLNKDQRTALDQAMHLTTQAIQSQAEEHGGVYDSAKMDHTIDVANERLSEMVQDDNTQYNMLLESKRNASTANNAASVPGSVRMDIRDHIAKVLGPDVLVAFKRIMHEGDFTPNAQGYLKLQDLIRISIHSMDPWSTAYHESMHGFVNNMRRAGLHDITNVLQKAADSEYVRKEMERIVGKDPAAMAQLRGADPEERIAYMYQMWANGQLKLDGQPATFFSKLFKAFREITGIWTNDDRATHIMDYFHSGEYAKDMGNRDLVMAKTMEVHSGIIGKALKAVRVPYDALSDSVIAAGGQKVRNTNNPHLDRLVDLIKPKPGDTKSGDVGYIRSSRLAKTTYMNKFAAEMQNLTKEQQDQVLESLQTTLPAASPEARLAARNVRGFLQEMHKYITDAGVEIGNLDSSYFPRVWDTNYISKNQTQFRAMLDKYVQRGDIGAAEADEFMYKLIRNNGNEFDVDTLRPGFQANKERVLSFIEHEDAAEFQSKDLFRTVNDYVTQATRRAEWTRRFSGEDEIDKIFQRAKNDGATNDDLAATRRYLQGITGVLGDDMNPTLRRLQGNVMVYQNIRLLPLAIFSSIVDPQGIIARGGSMGEAFQAFKYGISQIPNNLRGIPKSDIHAQLAETMGTIENAMLAGTLGESYQQGMVGETGRKINDKFFKYNLMEGWNRSMRIAATHAAINFIHTHADGSATKHSARFMDEMGLKTQDIHYKADGSLKLHEGDGLTPAQAAKMRVAVNNWVDGAILRPDAADKPTWAHDPRFALLFHLKQFTYSFQSTMLDRMWNEAKNGNYQPMMGLASYVPVMIAADALKGLLLTGGEPDRKKDWGVGEYVGEGVERAGLYGVGQYRHDVIREWHKGNTGLGAVRGPTLDQLTEAVEMMRGREAFGTFALHSLPANKIFTSH